MNDQLSTEQLEVLLGAAVAAPSMHNTQPWRFEVDGHVINVFLDGSRALPAEDPSGRAMRIAAGAAVFNLRCAAASLGLSSWFGLMPNPHEPDLVARLVIEETDQVDRALLALYPQVPRRHTSRAPGRPVEPAPTTRVELMQAAVAEGAALTWLPKASVSEVLDMLLDTDLREIGDWHRSAERAHWVGGSRTADGVPSAALGPRSATYPAPVRDMGTAPRDRLRPRAQFEADPALAVLSTETDRPADQLVAGIALERVLLTATREALSASFLNQPLEYDDLRERVQATTGKPGYAHMVIRFAHNGASAATPRRPLSEFVTQHPRDQVGS
jgi:hypothetical protein